MYIHIIAMQFPTDSYACTVVQRAGILDKGPSIKHRQTHIHIQSYTHTHTYTHIHTHSHTSTHTYTHIHIHIAYIEEAGEHEGESEDLVTSGLYFIFSYNFLFHSFL